MSKETLIYYGKVKDGKLLLPRTKIRKEAVKAFNGMAIEVSIKRKRKQRSTPQNAYYWSVPISMIAEHLNDSDMGYFTSDRVHEILKFKFLRQTEINENTGEILMEYCKSTTDLTTTEFMDYITNIQAWASEMFSIYIPDPNEVNISLESF